MWKRLQRAVSAFLGSEDEPICQLPCCNIKPGKSLPVVVDVDEDTGDDTFIEAHNIVVGLMQRLRPIENQQVQEAVAWAEKALWG